MKRSAPAALLSLTLVLTIVSQAAAQVPFTQSRSFSFSGRSGGVGAVGGQAAFSPYLNLLRSGNSTLLNYYGLVRPEQEFRQANQQFQSSLGQVRADFQQQQFDVESELFLPESGHRVQFQSDLRGPARFTSSRSSRTGTGGSQTGSTYTLSPTGHGVSFGNNGNFYPAGTSARPSIRTQR